MRGTFANIRLKNLLVPGEEGGVTKHLPDGRDDAHLRRGRASTRQEGTPLVVIAGKDYGMGSSRDWAAKGTLLLGVKAVIAESFERIHRCNLVGMGVLPLQFQDGRERRVPRPRRHGDVHDHRHQRRADPAADVAVTAPQGRRPRDRVQRHLAASTRRSRSSTTRTAACCRRCCGASRRRSRRGLQSPVRVPSERCSAHPARSRPERLTWPVMRRLALDLQVRADHRRNGRLRPTPCAVRSWGTEYQVPEEGTGAVPKADDSAWDSPVCLLPGWVFQEAPRRSRGIRCRVGRNQVLAKAGASLRGRW